ncbi:MAG TPA: 50S ribosomal protein L21 [Candidatus Dormibacteraeota bacterium]|nr:50S ribosomal protein L21 [Candidatus Dormibacteraeota bacterium]
MYAIVQVGGRQYRAAAGQRLVVDRLDVEPGSRVHLDDVRMLVAEEGDDAETEIGRPRVADVAVAARAISHFRGPKILVFKYKPKKRYRRHQGFRAELTELRIEEVRRGAYEDKPATVVTAKRPPSARAEKPEAPASAGKRPVAKAESTAGSAKKALPTRRPTTAAAAEVSEEAQPPTKTVPPKVGSPGAPSARAASGRTAPDKSASVKKKAEKSAPATAKPKATTTPKKPAAKAPAGEKKSPRSAARRSGEEERPDGS